MRPHTVVPLRRAALLVTAVLLLAACTAGASPGSAGPAGSAAASSGPTPTHYPGWPDGSTISGTPSIVPILVSSDVAVGKNRFLLSLADAQNNLLAAPDMAVQMRFYDLAVNPAKVVTQSDGRFVWAVPNQRGLYEADVAFDRAGDWGVEVTARKAAGAAKTVRATFEVHEKSATPPIGAPAPASDSAVLRPGVAIGSISTDPHPDPSFYQLSIRQAIAAHKPFVVVFATPKFCTSQVCGPTLDNVKAVSKSFTGKVNFIHVEVYTNLSAPNNLQLVPAVREWGLPSEPWVFVVGANGRIADKFEGICPPDELAAAIRATLG